MGNEIKEGCRARYRDGHSYTVLNIDDQGGQATIGSLTEEGTGHPRVVALEDLELVDSHLWDALSAAEQTCLRCGLTRRFALGQWDYDTLATSGHQQCAG